MGTKTKASTIEKDKLDIIRWVTALNDETSIERLKMLKNNHAPADWWDEISEAEKSAIDEGLEDLKEGRTKPHDEVKKIYEKWL